MRSVGIVADCHCGISQEMAREMGIWVLPMPFFIDGKCYNEGLDITRDEFYEKLKSGREFSTSQPSLGEVMHIWDQALKEYEKIVYLPLGKGLSGSYNAALVLAKEPAYEGRVFVGDVCRTSTPLRMLVMDVLEMADRGCSAEEIIRCIDYARDKQVIFIGVATLENLKKGGRITPATAAIGSVLNIKPVLKMDVGPLDSYKKCRGMQKAKKTMLEVMHEELGNRFRPWKERGELHLMVATSCNREETLQWVDEVQASFPDMEVSWDYLSMGVCCHTGYGALGTGFSCKLTEGMWREGK